MKFRLGFVTNSSSSSYVIAIKDIGIEEELFNQLPQYAKNAINVYQKLMKADADQTISSIEELNEYFVYEYYYGKDKTLSTEEKLQYTLNDDDWCKVRYNKWFENIKNGYIIVIHDVEYSDESKREMFDKLADEEQIIILESE